MTVKEGQPTRLYVKGIMMGFKRGQRTQYEHTSLLKIQGLDDKDDVDFYLGKRVAYIYKVFIEHGNRNIVYTSMRLICMYVGQDFETKL